MKRRTTPLIITAFLSLIVFTGTALAEVSVVNDGKGNYIKTLLLFKDSNGYKHFWEPVRNGIASYLMLNREGDLIGDGKPFIAEHPFDKLPWVVWSHFNGQDHDIVWSRWDGEKWTMIAPVIQSEEDDGEPTLAFEPSGIPFVAFTRKSERSQIFLTAFLNGKWTNPLLVSDPTVDCTNPVLIFGPDVVAMAFLTPEGIKVIYLNELPVYDPSDIEEGPNPLPGYLPGTTTGGFNGGERSR